MGIQPPPPPPHMGGSLGALGNSTKKELTVVLQNQVVTDKVLNTAMAEVESLPNSRPLVEVSSDVDDLEALMPNHFILGRPNLHSIGSPRNMYIERIQ